MNAFKISRKFWVWNLWACVCVCSNHLKREKTFIRPIVHTSIWNYLIVFPLIEEEEKKMKMFSLNVIYWSNFINFSKNVRCLSTSAQCYVCVFYSSIFFQFLSGSFLWHEQLIIAYTWTFHISIWKNS